MSVVVLALAVWLLLFLPGVQNFAAQRAAEAASRALGVTVAFDRVHFGLFNSIEIKGLYIEDLDRDTLLYAARAKVESDFMGALWGRSATLGSVRLDGGRIGIRRYGDGQTNISKLLTQIRRDEPATGGFSIGTVRLSEMTVSVDDLLFEDVEMRMTGLAVMGDSVFFKLGKLSGHEKTGLQIDRISSGGVTIAGGGVRLDDARVCTPDTDLRISRLSFDAEKRFEAEITDSRLGVQTAARFVPTARRADIQDLHDFNLSLAGSFEDFSGRLTTVINENTTLAATFAVQGITDIANAVFSVEIEEFTTDAETFASFLKPFPGEQIAYLGAVSLRGNAAGRLNDFTMHADVATGQGMAEVNATLRRLTDFDVRLKLTDFNLLAVGQFTGAANAKGTFARGHLLADIDATVSELAYNGRRFRDAQFDGRIDGRQFSGVMKSRDANLHFDLDALTDLREDLPRYDFTLALRHADLRALGFDRDATLAFDARIDGRGRNLDNANGQAYIDNLLYISDRDTVRTSGITFAAGNGEFILDSPLAVAELRSDMSTAALGNRLGNAMHPYFPSLFTVRRAAPTAAGEVSLNIRIKEEVAFASGLLIAEGTEISARLGTTDSFTLSAHSDFIELGESFVSGLAIDGAASGEKFVLNVNTQEVYTGGIYAPNLAAAATARGDIIDATVTFDDAAGGDRTAFVNLAAKLGRNDASGDIETTVRVMSSSYYRYGTQRWDVVSGDIAIARNRIRIDSFEASGGGQRLAVSGTASGNLDDTLLIEVTNVDINPLSPIINAGHEFHGHVNGEARIRSVLGSARLNARAELDDMKVDHVAVPPLLFLSAWEGDDSRVRMMLLERETGNTIAAATVLPATGQIEGTLRMQNVDLSLLDIHCEGTLSRAAGRADVDATIGGYGRNVKLNGTIDIHEYQATLDFLNVVYSTVGATQMTLRDNIIEAHALPIGDPEGGRGTMDARIDLNRLNNVSYEFDISTDNILALDTSWADNELFYGRVYASGNVAVSGSKRGVTLNITAATDDGSRFFMPLDESPEMEEADFVRFIQPSATGTSDSTEYNTRRRMITERQRRNRIEPTGNLNANIALTVRPNTLVELHIDPQTGHKLRGRGNGLINMHLNPRNNEFTIYGDYRISEGVYLFTLENIIEKPFTIDPGSSIQWTGDPIDALMDITGIYGLKTSISPAVSAAVGGDVAAGWRTRVPVECRIRLTDRLSQPTLTFNITAPGATPEVQNILAGFLNTQEMVATQFFFLLATGNFYDYDGGAVANIGAAAGSATAFDFLSNQLSNWISSDRFDVGFRYRPQTETTSDEWGFDFSQRLLGDRLLLEIEGNYDTRSNAEAVYSENMRNFTGDAYLTALLDRTGNARGKLFSRTITRFDENRGLQEWGAGLYYTEDFNTFGEVLRRMRDRFTGERRALRRQQRIVAANESE
ncbi:MAG: translocation/assembly module TamB [Rikenellaceae bacterium]|nr:translocation/assembly module TamB [Rikenellaceae bacterium]MCL2693427.1 translocation/assembly module TamB [Rikenellaceae bacterium]